jgi:hypothetical protein
MARTSAGIANRPAAPAALGALLLAACALLAAPAGGTTREYEIKAAFLYNFVKFVDWPAQALPDNSPNVVIGVLGANPFGRALNTINGRSVKGKTLVVRQVSSAQDAQNCHMLFICPSERDRLRAILDALRNDSVLTVGEMKGFAESGGIINFTLQNDRVRFEINPAAAERARLTISSQLLRLAKIVRG